MCGGGFVELLHEIDPIDECKSIRWHPMSSHGNPSIPRWVQYSTTERTIGKGLRHDHNASLKRVQTQRNT